MMFHVVLVAFYRSSCRTVLVLLRCFCLLYFHVGQLI